MMKWWFAFIEPKQRFKPMPSGALLWAITEARKQEMQSELCDPEWPDPYWETMREFD